MSCKRTRRDRATSLSACTSSTRFPSPIHGTRWKPPCPLIHLKSKRREQAFPLHDRQEPYPPFRSQQDNRKKLTLRRNQTLSEIYSWCPRVRFRPREGETRRNQSFAANVTRGSGLCCPTWISFLDRGREILEHPFGGTSRTSRPRIDLPAIKTNGHVVVRHSGYPCLAHKNAPNQGTSGSRPVMRSAARSAIATTAALMLPLVRLGMTDASTTLRLSTP